MKKPLLMLILAILFLLLLSSCRENFVEYPFKQDFADWSELEPLIDGFNGDLFADRNITANGLYTGCEKIGWDMLHCYDNNSTIWFDRYNGSLYILDVNGSKEKICADKDCRDNINGECNHIPSYNCLYLDKFIYFTYGGYDTEDVEVNYFGDLYETRQKVISKGLFIYRYDTDTYEVQKIMEFQGVTECELAVNGRYLYAETYAWEYVWDKGAGKLVRSYKADFAIIRIDLLDENAVIVYSDMSNRDDFDKISDAGNFKFISDKIIMPINNNINICTIDMQKIRTLIELDESETIGDLYLYENDIYFITQKWTGGYYGENSTVENRFCRVSIEMYDRYVKDHITNSKDEEKAALLDSNKREILNKNISSFCIDGDFLYYVVGGGTSLYRIKLDYSRELDFYNTFAVYTPENGESFNYYDWKVCGGYLYMTLYKEESALRCRQKLLSENDFYVFYREKYFT